MDACTFRYLFILVAKKGLNIHLMDVVTTYLYGSLNNEIYMKLLKGYNLLYNVSFKGDFSIKLNKSLYGLKTIRTYVV